VEITSGWEAVLADICGDIDRLQRLVPIVQRKIERREPWPGKVTQLHAQSSDHKSESATQC